MMCILILCTILTLGLWPFHSPRNNVAWMGNQNGLRFGKYGTVISSGAFQVANPRNNLGASLEIWIQPKRIWDSGTFLAFYKPGNLFQFSMYQLQTDLRIRTGRPDGEQNVITSKLYAEKVFLRKPQPVFITVTAGLQGARIYIDGVLATSAPHFPISAENFVGRLVLGDSPGQSDCWSGQLLGLAIYHRQLTAIQVLRNYATWKQTGRPTMTEEELNVALYLFDAHGGDVVTDRVRSGVDLFIPKTYQVMDKMFLEPFWSEFTMSWRYWRAALKNIVGFIPLGFCFYAFLLTVLSSKRAALATVVMGTAVSLTIEVAQAFLPTRDSGTTDLITNTLGTWVGVESYCWLIPILVRLFPQMPFHACAPD